MEREIYWLWLQGAVGYAKPVKKLINTFGDAKGVYEASTEDIAEAQLRGFNHKAAVRIKDEDIEKYYDTYDFCLKHKIRILTPDSEFYPQRLLETENFPLALYVRGDYTCLNAEKALGVIGSRTPSMYGEEATRTIVSQLCENGVLIVSGGAVGIDTIAHRTAIECGGRTVLVMGCGHGSGYLPENSALRKRVAENGALITEFPPFTNVSHGSFPQRNRIISGMTSGVVIAEAARLSGTFSTARHAVRQGRELFVLPGDIKSGNYEGSNQLISEGAKPVFSAKDIIPDAKVSVKYAPKTGNPFENIELEASSYKKRGKKKASETEKKEVILAKEEKNLTKIQKINLETISKNAEIVYNIMSDGICVFDGIVRESGLEVRKVLSALTELEMNGAVIKESADTYRLNQ
ncbi:MAG: DNA-protecting protein DprA [Ruminococcaceae bacterium]|nr:DNA-protecting protein DprA [Oscillospiraceae bacterium]